MQELPGIAGVGKVCPDVWTVILHTQQRLRAVSRGEGSWASTLQLIYELGSFCSAAVGFSSLCL